MTTEKLIYGTNAIIKLIEQNHEIINKLYVLKINKKTKHILYEAKIKNIKTVYINYIHSEKLTYLRKYNSIICKIKHNVINTTSLLDLIKIKENLIILILDRIQDPYNFAACIRTAEAFSVTALITNEKNCAKNSPLLSKISNGSNIFMNIIIDNDMPKIIELLKLNNIKIIGLSSKAKKHIDDIKLTPPLAIIMGSEKNGITKSISKLCTNICKIPLSIKSKSINVSVATGIMLSKITH